MKELHKRLLALGMGAVMIFAMGAAGCNSGNQGQTPSTGTTTPDPDKDKDKDKGEPSVTPDPDKDQDDPTQTPAKTKAEAISAFNAAVQKINADKNFTYTEIGAEYVAEFEGAKLKVTENGASVFYATEDDQNYSYTLRDSVWHKDFSETTAAGIFSSLTAALSDVVWSDFEAEENLLTGTASGETIKATVTETALTVETAQKKFTLTNLGTTAVSLPADAVDDTDASNFIFTTDENGEYALNVKLVADALKQWWPKGYYKSMTDVDSDLIDVFAVEYKNSELHLMTYLSGPSGKYLQNFVIPKVYMDKWADSNHLNEATRQDFLDFLISKEQKFPLQIVERRIGEIEYTTLDEDYETAHKQEFETLTKNGFERLATVGYKYLTDNEGTKVDFSGAKVLFGFRTPLGDLMLMPNSTYHRAWHNYYLLERDGKMELINFFITGRTGGPGAFWDYTAMESVLQNITKAWNISRIERREISTENLVLFDAPIMTIGKIA